MGCLINFDGDTMILTGNEDLRVQKTIDSINRTFEEMLIEMDYSQITVKELTERAKINKKTFYRYYECMDDLLAEKQEMITAECLQNISGYEIPEELDKIIQSQFLFSIPKVACMRKLFAAALV